MERCHGKTKAGARCKRSAREGSIFCASHAGQEEPRQAKEKPRRAKKKPRKAEPSAQAAQERDPLDTLIGVAVFGALLWAALTFRRVFRF